GALLADVLSNDINFTNNPESVQAKDLMEQKVTGPQPHSAVYIVRSSQYTVADPQFKAYTESVKNVINRIPGGIVVRPAVTYYDAPPSPQTQGLVSQDQHASLIPVYIKNEDASTADALRTAASNIQRPGLQLLFAGNAILNADT